MSNEKRDRFNLETMSGIHPGTRTKVFQRVALDDAQLPNAQIAWYTDPVACVVTRDGTSDALLRAEASLDEPLGPFTFAADLLHGLEKVNTPLRTCGTCLHWQKTAAVTADGLVLGTCNFGKVDGADNEQARQSMLALACSHWGQQEAQIAWSNPQKVEAQAEAALTDGIDDPKSIATERDDSNAQLDGTLLLKTKEQTEVESQIEGRRHDDSGSNGGLFSRLKNLFGPPSPQPSPPSSTLSERSGVGAGTESCFACQGRIANLGALVVQTDEGDKQTLSVWRCRNCFTFYLNNWIDRWERLDNLETEEVYYRLAPSEALMLLQEVDSVRNGDHPQGSADRGTERAVFTNFMADRQPLSHQIKHGR